MVTNTAERFRELVALASSRLPPAVRVLWGGHALTAYVADIREVASRLTAADVAGEVRFPAVILPRDYLEELHADGAATIRGASVLIVTGSGNGYTSEEREAKVFVPILYPITEALLGAARETGVLEQGGRPVEKVDRQGLSAALNELVLPVTGASLFNATLDGVELRGLSLTFDCNPIK